MPEPRSYYEQIASERGYQPVDSVTKDLSLLVANDINSSSSKLAKAAKLSVKLMSLDDWLRVQTPIIMREQAPDTTEKQEEPVPVQKEEASPEKTPGSEESQQMEFGF